MSAIRSLGAKLLVGSVPVGGLTSIGSPSISAETIDVTTLDSEGGYREHIAGFKDGGDVAVEGFYYDTDAGQIALTALLENGDKGTFAIQFPAPLTTQWAFSGVVTALETPFAVEDAVGFSATIKVSGAPTLTRGGGTNG